MKKQYNPIIIDGIYSEDTDSYKTTDEQRSWFEALLNTCANAKDGIVQFGSTAVVYVKDKGMAIVVKGNVVWQSSATSVAELFKGAMEWLRTLWESTKARFSRTGVVKA